MSLSDLSISLSPPTSPMSSFSHYNHDEAPTTDPDWWRKLQKGKKGQAMDTDSDVHSKFFDTDGFDYDF